MVPSGQVRPVRVGITVYVRAAKWAEATIEEGTTRAAPARELRRDAPRRRGARPLRGSRAPSPRPAAGAGAGGPLDPARARDGGHPDGGGHAARRRRALVARAQGPLPAAAPGP